MSFNADNYFEFRIQLTKEEAENIITIINQCPDPYEIDSNSYAHKFMDNFDMANQNRRVIIEDTYDYWVPPKSSQNTKSDVESLPLKKKLTRAELQYIKYNILKEKAVKKSEGNGKKMKTNKKYFLAVCRAETGDWKYNIYFANDSDMIVLSLKVGSGSFATQGDEVITTSPVVKNFGSVGPQSYVCIDTVDGYDLDFNIHYELTVKTDAAVETLNFYLGKNIGFLGNDLPIINKMGRRMYSY